MLYEISCSEFKCKGKERNPIIFNEGLNIVTGTDDGTNSIGKSTFLYIIDFVLGGDDYLNKQKKAIEKVGEHIINFTLKFDNDYYYFSRSTSDKGKTLTLWNDSSRTEGTQMMLENYRIFLANNYQIPSGATFRGTVGHSFRMGNKDTVKNTEHPLNASGRESDENAIANFLKSFGEYAKVKQAQDEKDEVESKLSSLRKSSEYKYVSMAKNATDVKRNIEQIKKLEEEARSLVAETDYDVTSLDASKLRQITPIKEEIKQCQEQKAAIESEIRSIQISQGDRIGTVDKDYDELCYFFPDTNVRALEEIQNFHKGLSVILKKECEEKLTGLLNTRDVIALHINELMQRIDEIAAETNVSKSVLDEYSTVRAKIEELSKANRNFNLQDALKTELDEKNKNLQETFSTVIKTIQDRVNEKMQEIASSLGKKGEEPTLSIDKATKYEFVTGVDTGSGTSNRSVIIMDLALLSLSCLPAIIHDSSLFKQIEKPVMERLFKIYASSSKQIFISADMLNIYGEDAEKLVKEYEVLHLESGECSLFGRKL